MLKENRCEKDISFDLLLSTTDIRDKECFEYAGDISISDGYVYFVLSQIFIYRTIQLSLQNVCLQKYVLNFLATCLKRPTIQQKNIL